MPEPKAMSVTQPPAQHLRVEPEIRKPADGSPTGSAEENRAETEPEMEGSSPSVVGAKASTRIDRWLTATRIYKSRSQAQIACEAGHVSVNGVAVKSSRTVQIGDKVVARAPRGLVVAIVAGVEEKRQGAARARELYDDQSPPPVDRGLAIGYRPRGSGRPTKADRRAIARLIDEEDE